MVGRSHEVLTKLGELEKASPPRSVELYLRLTRLQWEARSSVKVNKAHLSQEVIDERVGLGVSLLSFDELELDWSAVEQLFRQSLSLLAEYSPSIDPSHGIPLRALIESWYNMSPVPHDGMDEDILAVAVHTSVKPFLANWSEVLLSMINQSQWRRGYCPVCGGTPNFAYLEAEQGARWLCCPRCDAEWLFQRLECSFCGNTEQKQLGFFADREERYRVYFCGVCEGYLKTIDLRKGDQGVVIPLEWVSTLDLDRQACEKGYKAGVVDKSIVKERDV